MKRFLRWIYKIRNFQKMPKVIVWQSAGVTSAVAGKVAIDLFGKNNVAMYFIDTKNEDDDSYRFLKDLEIWYDMPINVLTSDKFESIQDVWISYATLNTANGAICSSELKRAVRLAWQKKNQYRYQVFGYEMKDKEFKRALAMTLNYPDAKSIYPLLMMGYNKQKCADIIIDAGIMLPESYRLGYENNNCAKTRCIQGGIGYWQKVARDEPAKFDSMADLEHYLTWLRGKPVTILKDQSKGGGLVFLKHNRHYPLMKDLSMMKGREPEPILECNGHCGIDDLTNIKTQQELNFTLFL